MFYDNVYVLSDCFYRILLDNPDLQRTSSYAETPSLTQRLEEWLEHETDITDLSHKDMWLQLASTYEAIVDMRDATTISAGS